MLTTSRPHRLTPWAAPALVFAAGALALRIHPAMEVSVLAQGAARVAGALTGSPVAAAERGWTLLIGAQPVIVTDACSAAGFFLSAACVFAWQLARRGRSTVIAASLAFALALPLTFLVNAWRVVCLAQVHRWVVPLLPEPWSAALHMSTGVAIFLPALLGLNLILETHGRARTSTARC